ncbi:HSF-type DNA-binding-domain-containing protein [Globomyces pollinis-pini]|nr:HSF-type DNA-binding-domain-containing protein [Globomyces pollinis-pini]
MESQQPTVGIASFIQKLDLMLRDESTKDTVYWGPFNDTVIIKNNDYFTNFVLPNYFRHNQMSSFIRQMNKHGFHRIKSDRLVDRKENDIYEYKNEYFQRGNRDRWSSICCGNALPKPGPIHEINVKQKLQELSDDNERLKSQSNMSRDKCAQLERSVRLCHEKIAKQTALINRITELISAKGINGMNC